MAKRIPTTNRTGAEIEWQCMWIFGQVPIITVGIRETRTLETKTNVVNKICTFRCAVSNVKTPSARMNTPAKVSAVCEKWQRIAIGVVAEQKGKTNRDNATTITPNATKTDPDKKCFFIQLAC